MATSRRIGEPTGGTSLIGSRMTQTSRSPSLEEIRARRDEIERVVAAASARNVRVFGSVARGEASDGSDVDLLVDVVVEARGLAYFGLLEDLRRSPSDLLGRDVHVVDSVALRSMKQQVLREAVPL